jgi:HD-like signal output (HDOD) protein
MDIGLKGENSFELCSILSSTDETRSIPIMVFTGLTTRLDVVKSLKAGAADFMSKGAFTIDYFIKKIENQIGKKKEKVVSEYEKENSKETKKIISEAELNYRLSRISDLKAVPFIIFEILDLKDDDESNVAKLAEIIKKDQALSLHILKLSNSSYYKSLARITSIETAIMQLGFKKIKEVAMGFSVIEKFMESPSENGINRFLFWEHCLGCGIFAKAISQEISYPYHESAFLAGLLHDIGKSYFDDYFHDEYVKVLNLSKEYDKSLEEVEQKLLGLNHADLISILYAKKSLPEPIKNTILYHQKSIIQLSQLFVNHMKLVEIIFVADYLTKLFRLGEGYNPYINVIPDYFVKNLKLDSSRLDKIINKVISQFTENQKNILGFESEDSEIIIKNQDNFSFKLQILSCSSIILNPISLIAKRLNAEVITSSRLYPFYEKLKPDVLIFYVMTQEDFDYFFNYEMEQIIKLQKDMTRIFLFCTEQFQPQNHELILKIQTFIIKNPIPIKQLEDNLNLILSQVKNENPNHN